MTLPEWVEEHIHPTCAYCGSPITNNETLTDRYCSNPNCPEHMAQKIVALAKRLGVKGVGEAYARNAVRYQKFRYHTQIIPLWFDSPLVLPLWEVGELCMIKGHQSRWRSYCEGHDTMQEVLEDRCTPQAIRDAAPLLLYTESICKVKRRLEGKILTIMMSGSFDNYRSRADFVTDMNTKYGDVVQLVDVGKRKTGVEFLVKEAHATDHEKSAIAAAYGIEVITPKALEEKIVDYRTYILGGGQEQ